MDFKKNKASAAAAVLMAVHLTLLTGCGDKTPDDSFEEMPSMTVYPSFDYLETTAPPTQTESETRSGQTYPDMTGTELATTYTDEYGNIYGITTTEASPETYTYSGEEISSSTRDEFGVDLSDFPDVGISEYYRNTDPANTLVFDPVTSASTERPAEISSPYSVYSVTDPSAVTTETSTASTTDISEETTAFAEETRELTNAERVAERNAAVPSKYTNNNEVMHTYSYNSLTSTQQYVYDVITSACLDYEDKVTFRYSDKVTFDDLFIAYQTLYLDEVRLFYIDKNISYVSDNSTGYILSMNINYSYSEDQVNTMKQEMDEKTDEILAGVTKDMSDYEVVKYIHDKLITLCDYTISGSYVTTSYGAIVKNKAQCQGYSRAFSYLCDLCGIETDIILGESQQHMWNMVKLDGKWYHIDLTWDDPNKSDYPDAVFYDYFCVSTDRMLEFRTIDGNSHELPEAESNDLEYYTYNSLVVSSVSEARELFAKEAAKASEEGRPVVQFRCSTSEVYEEIIDEFFSNNKQNNILDMVDDVNETIVNKLRSDSVYHYTNADTLIVKIFLNYS
ncbi:MAG: transglutaminase domain-containing protein [Oscillospiraceae bacterium]